MQFEEIYEKYDNYISYLLKGIYNKEDALDLQQDIWLTIWQKMDCIEEGKEKAFIRKVTWNIIGNYISKYKGKENMMSKLKMLYKATYEDDTIAYFNIMDLLQSSMQEWEYDYITYFLQGIKQSELADYLGVPQSYISKHMQKAIEHAREILSDEDEYLIDITTPSDTEQHFIRGVVNKN